MIDVSIDDGRTHLTHFLRSVSIEEETRPIPRDPRHAYYPVQGLVERHVSHVLVGRTIGGVALCGVEVVTSDPSAVREGVGMPRFPLCPECTLRRGRELIDRGAPPASPDRAAR